MMKPVGILLIININQVAIDKEMISNTGLLKEGQEVDILFHAETEKH